MLFLAAVTSSISMYQPSVAFLQEALGVDRRRGTLAMVAICLVGSFMVVYFTEGAVFWNTLDFWVGTFLILIMAMVEIICFSWIFGIDMGWEEIHHGAQIRIPKAFRFIMKYVSPVYLLIVLIAFCFANLPTSIAQISEQPMAQLALALIAGIMLILMLCVRVGEKRWRELGMDLDGKEGLPDLVHSEPTGGDR